MSNVHDERDIAFLRLQVELAGAVWVGIQEGFADFEALVLFNDPDKRYGSTCSMKVSKVSVESVHDKFIAKRREFRKDSA